MSGVMERTLGILELLCRLPGGLSVGAIAARLDEVARRARLMPGEGGIDLAGLARAIPPDTVISVEIPNHALAERMGAVERAARALRSTRAVIEGTAVGDRSRP